MPQCSVHLAHFSEQAGFVHTAQLVQQYAGLAAFEANFRAAAQRLSGAGQRGDDDPWQDRIHVIGGYNQRRPGLADFRADGGVQIDPENISAPYQVHSLSFSSSGMVSSTASSASGW